MTGIREWLASLGLEKYARHFEQAEIDIETVPYLTESDLNELGLPIGPRRKMLAAAESRRSLQNRPVEDPALRERRHVTVMFVDLVGSTRLAVRIDPEMLGELLKNFKPGRARQHRGG